MELWVGIDPGIRGAVAAVDSSGSLQEVFLLNGDARVFYEWASKSSIQIKHVYLEKAQPMPKQGICSVFNYSNGWGQLQGICIALELPFTLVPPQVWQKTMFVGTSKMCGKKKRNPKERALEAANRVFAKKKRFWLATKRSTKPHDGLIDAALLAEACRRNVG